MARRREKEGIYFTYENCYNARNGVCGVQFYEGGPPVISQGISIFLLSIIIMSAMPERVFACGGCLDMNLTRAYPTLPLWVVLFVIWSLISWAVRAKTLQVKKIPNCRRKSGCSLIAGIGVYFVMAGFGNGSLIGPFVIFFFWWLYTTVNDCFVDRAYKEDMPRWWWNMSVAFMVLTACLAVMGLLMKPAMRDKSSHAKQRVVEPRR